jgi:hypothetical protein
MYEVTDPRKLRSYGVTIMPDIKPFVSPITGKEITGRKALRDHNKQFNVTNTADFKGEWEHKAKERAKLFLGDPSFDSNRRKEHIIRAMEIHTRRGK